MVTRRQILEDIGIELPDVNYKKITVKTSGDNIAIDLELALLDVQGPKGQTTWYSSSYMRNRIKYVVVAITDATEKQKINSSRMFRHLYKKTTTSDSTSDLKVLNADTKCHVKICSVENNKKISDLRSLNYEKESGFFEAPQNTSLTFDKKPNYLCFLVFPIIFRLNSSLPFYDFSQRVLAGTVKEFVVINSGGVIRSDKKIKDETIITGKNIDKVFNVDSRFSKNITSNSILKEAALNNSNSYLSKITLSKDKDNSVGGIFYLDVFSMLRKLSQYSTEIKNLLLPDHKSFVFNKTRIKYIKIYRKRISIAKDGTMIDFKKTSPVSVLENGGTITEIKTSKNMAKVSDQSIRTFKFVDPAIAEIDVGKYQYGVEVVLEDGTLKLMNNLLTKLNNGRSLLEDYYAKASKTGNYISAVKRFDSKFVNTFKGASRKPWIISTVNYVYAAMFFAKELGIVDKQDTMISSIVDSISPSSGNLGGIEKLMLSYDNLINYYMKIMKTKLNGYASESGKKVVPEKLATNLITVKRYSAIQDIKNNVGKTRKFGKDIFGDIVSGNSGIPVVTTGNYKKRVKQENEMYWDIKGSSGLGTIEKGFKGGQSLDKKVSQILDLENNSYSYLTPAKIFGDGMEIDRVGKGNKNFSPMKYNQMSITTINQNKKNSVGSEKIITIKDNRNIFESEENLLSFHSFLRDMDAQVYTKKEYLKKKDVNADNKTKKMSAYVSDDNTTLDTTLTSKNNRSLLADKNSDLLTTKTSLMYTVSSIFTSRGRTDFKKGTKTNPNVFGIKNYSITNEDKNILYDVEGKKIPNQIRSIMLGEINSGVVRKDWLSGSADPVNNTDQAEMFKQNYRDITKIEYLASVKEYKDGDFKEKYEILDKRVIDGLKKGEQLICRAVKYNNDVLGLTEDNENTEMEIYDRTFIISTTPTVSKPRAKAEQRGYKKMISDLVKSESKKLSSRQEFVKRNVELKSSTTMPRKTTTRGRR